MRLTLAILALVCTLVPAPAAAQSGPRNCTRDAEPVRPRRARRVLPVVPRAAAAQSVQLRLARGVSGSGSLPPARHHFSYITSRAANDAFYGDSQFVGLGISTQTSDTEMSVLQVFPDSPASRPGWLEATASSRSTAARVADLIASGQIGSAFGASRSRASGGDSWFSRGRAANARDADQTCRHHSDGVAHAHVSGRRADGRAICFFRNFVEPSYAALDEAFAALREAGATELVIDLRYNGGGLVDVAVHLGEPRRRARSPRVVCSRVPAQRQEQRLNEDAAIRVAAAGAEPVAAVRHHDSGVGVGERAADQQPAAAHAGRRDWRRHLRQTGRSVRLRRSATRCSRRWRSRW